MKTKNLLLFATLFFAALLTLSLTTLKSGSKGTNVVPNLKNGEKIVMNYCALCHGGEDGKLSGKMMEDIPKFFGTIHTANITNHPEKGIGKYTREQLRVLLRTRQKADGKKVNMVMPAFPLMSDEDLEGIIEFLKSDHFAVQSSEATFPPQTMKWIARSFDKKIKILKMPAAVIPAPDTTNPVAWGKYLVTGAYRCYECHSGEMIPDDENPTASKRYMEGGHTMYDLQKKKLKVPNITPDKETGIGNWTEEDFYKLLNQGIRKNGRNVRFPMAPLPGLSRNEVNAIYAYLMSIKPIKNRVK